MNIKPGITRAFLSLLAITILVSMNGVTFAENRACYCCSDRAMHGHMKKQSISDCDGGMACNHCAFESSRMPSPWATLSSDHNSRQRSAPRLFVSLQTHPAEDYFLSSFSRSVEKTASAGISAKIPIYLYNQILRF